MIRDGDGCCRNCGAADVVLHPTGIYAPFFLNRVFGIRTESLGERLGALAREAPSCAKRLLARALLQGLRQCRAGQNFLAFAGTARTTISACSSCGFVGPARFLPEAWISQLYLDYRQDSYNRDRIAVEPSYGQIAAHIGTDSRECKARRAQVDELLARRSVAAAVATVLDWGGGTGDFIPPSLESCAVTVFDIAPPARNHPDFRYLTELPLGVQFDYIQLCHVLEHLQAPRETLAAVLSHLSPGGFLYLEVPEDLSLGDLQNVRNGTATHFIHEHLNLYNEESLCRLGVSLGLAILEHRTVQLDLGYGSASVVAALFHRPDVQPLDTSPT